MSISKWLKLLLDLETHSTSYLSLELFCKVPLLMNIMRVLDQTTEKSEINYF